MADALNDAIDANATGPKKVVRDGVEVEQHSIPDQIALAKYRASAAAARKSGFPVRIQKFVPPGAP